MTEADYLAELQEAGKIEKSKTVKDFTYEELESLYKAHRSDVKKQSLFDKAKEANLIKKGGIMKKEKTSNDFTLEELEKILQNYSDKEKSPPVEGNSDAVANTPENSSKKKGALKSETKKSEKDPKDIEVDAEELSPKTLSNSANDTVKDNVSDVVLLGVEENNWRLLCKAFSKKEGWMKSTKALNLQNNHVLVQVTTQQLNIDGTYSIAEALTTVPGNLVKSTTDENIYQIAN